MKQFGNYDNVFIIGNENKEKEELKEEKEIKALQHASIKTQIDVKCFKWLGSFIKNKYADFFDYESNNFYLRDYQISSQGTIIDYFKVFHFKNEEVRINHSSDLNSEAHLFIQDNIVVSQLSLSLQNQLGYIIHYNPYAYIVCKYLDQSNPILFLMENDTIRIGKYSIEIKHIQIEGKKYTNSLICNKGLTMNSNSNKTDADDDSDNDIVCRICFRGGKDNNTFVSPCNCKGSLKYYHPGCLIQWIKSKYEVQFEYVNPFCYYIHLKNYKCEICKCTFPFSCMTNTNEVVCLLEEIEKKQSIMIIKTINTLSSNKTDLCPYEEYVMLDFSNRYKKELSVGRGRLSLYQLNDISLSRNHCSFILDNDVIRIKDCQSKFGTLIKMREDIILSKDNVTITLQKGNSAYHFVYKII